MERNPHFWFCVIGGVPKNELPQGIDYPMRKAVNEKFTELFGEQAPYCASGWGVDAEKAQLLERLACYDNNDLKKLILILEPR